MKHALALVGAIGCVLAYLGLTAPGRPSTSDRVVRPMAILGGMGARMRASGASSAAATAGFGLVVALTGSVPIAIVGACVAAAVATVVRGDRRRARMRRARQQWPDALSTMIAVLRSGGSLPEACMSLSKEAGGDLRHGFEGFARSYHSSGSFRSGLEALRDVLQDPVADRVAISLSLAHDVGGTDVVRILQALTEMIREDARVRGEIEARWSWNVSAARLAAASPVLVLLLMSTRPEAARAYATPAGIGLLIAGGVATVVGYLAMLQVARLPEDRRIG